MKLLLDTHLLLWAVAEPKKLSAPTRRMIENPRNQPMFSAASLWEIAIKNQIGRKNFRVEPRTLRRGLLDNGYLELPITGEHAVATDTLPSLHKDPFDRLLVAQAQVEGILLLTADQQVAQYPGPVRKV
jgi:PIN domain nuclease of toxin-antitoxin system